MICDLDFGPAHNHPIIKARGDNAVPSVHLSLLEGTSEAYCDGLALGVHEALVECMNVPPADRFQVLTEYFPKSLHSDESYLGIERMDKVVFVQIALNIGRSVEQKRHLCNHLCKRMAELLAENSGLRPQYLLINLYRGAEGKLVFQ